MPQSCDSWHGCPTPELALGTSQGGPRTGRQVPARGTSSGGPKLTVGPRVPFGSEALASPRVAESPWTGKAGTENLLLTAPQTEAGQRAVTLNLKMKASAVY